MGDDESENDRRNFTPEDEGKFTPEDEDGVLDAMQTSFAMWAMGIELMRASVDEWAKLRTRHLQASIKALSDVEQLPSDQKASAASDVAFNEVISAIKDFGTATIRATMFAGAAARQFEKETRKHRYPYA
jgi:hypothetical protein